MTQKVKTFLHIFQNSALPQAPYYHKLLKTKFSFSLKYFLTLVFCVNLIFFLFYFLKINPKKVASLKNSLSQSLQTFPKDLKITIRDGKLTTNSNRPYFFWLNQNGKKLLLAVVDEVASPEKINEYRSQVLLTSNVIVLNKKSFKTEKNLIPYQALQLTLTKRGINEVKDVVLRLFTVLIFIFFVLGIFVVPLFVSFSYLLSTLVLSILCFFLFKLFYKKHTFDKTFQLSLHAITIPFSLEFGLRYFSLITPIQPMRLLYAILTSIFILSALYEAYLDR